MIITLGLGYALAYFIWSIICMEINIRKARAMGLPVVCLPVDTTNVLWLTLQPTFWAVLERLPFRWSSYPDFIRFSRRDWHFRERADPAVRLGPVWALVTPVTIYLQITDDIAIRNIFARPADFVRPVKEYKLLEVYGPCLSTAGLDDWARHRKILAAPFNESIMKFVWDETLRQTRAMVNYWEVPSTSIPNVQKDLKTLAINVLAATAFKKSYEFRGSGDAQDEGSSYRNTLQTVLDNAILIMLFPYRFLKGPWVPEKLVKIGDAARSFKGYMIEMLDGETTAIRENKSGSGGMMGSFVRALDVHTREIANSPDVKASKDGKRGLSVDEIFGNIFILNFAGYDTTANTLAFALYLLAINPDVQTWLAEELTVVLRDADTTVENWDYPVLFSRLNRCRAILLETLRLFPPIVAVPKWTGTRPQTLEFQDEDKVRTITIPPGVYTSPHLIAVHTHPKYWSDPLAWKPSRWISSLPGTDTGGAVVDEELWEPAPNTYFPWSDGPQSCPGKKFIQVEALAVLAYLFKGHRLSVLKQTGESDRAAKKRIVGCLNVVNMDVILRMDNADKVKLVLSKV